MEDLIRNVEYYIQKDELKKRCRERKYVHKRIFFFNTLRNAGYTYQRIGEMFGLNHATIVHGIKTYKYWWVLIPLLSIEWYVRKKIGLL